MIQTTVADGDDPRFVALGHHFTLRCTHAGLRRYLLTLLAPFASSRPAPTHYRLDIDPGGTSSVWFGDACVVRTGDAAHAVAMFLWHLNQETIRVTTDRLLLHAGVVARDGRAVLLPAGMEAGKTTLVTTLVRAGAQYLSDELAALDPVTLEVAAYPKALSLDAGSWELFPDLEPDVDPAVLPLLPHQWQVPPDAVRAGSVRESATPTLIVLPRYRPSVRTALRRLEPVDALRELAGCTFGFREAPQRSLDVLGRLAAAVPAYRLSVSDLSEATDLVFDALARGVGTCA
ncbi:MAG TPA: hypothetical protein VHF25_04010 [Nitriliruptorales bacterium]|nr:hypothetical protein [Nitriliruptorales bacterium]